VLDNLSTHTTPEVKAWLEKNPNVQFHFTPLDLPGSTRSKRGLASSPARRFAAARSVR
jgi:hypothetical protein